MHKQITIIDLKKVALKNTLTKKVAVKDTQTVIKIYRKQSEKPAFQLQNVIFSITQFRGSILIKQFYHAPRKFTSIPS